MNTDNLKNQITISSFKHYPRMSEETNAFDCVVRFNGEPIGRASNRGCGGSTNLQLIYATKADFEEIKSLIEETVDDIVDDLIFKSLQQKEIKKIRRIGERRIAFLTKECLTTKGKYHAFKKGAIVDLSQIAKRQNFHKFIFQMTDEEIIDHFLKTF